MRNENWSRGPRQRVATPVYNEKRLCCRGRPGVFLQRDDNWIHVYDFGRVYTPLLVFLAVGWFRSGSTWLLLPVGLMLPRLGMQLGGQLLEVIRAATKS